MIKKQIKDFESVMMDISMHHDVGIRFFSDLPGTHLRYSTKNKIMRAALVSSMKSGFIIHIYKFVKFQWDKTLESKISNKYHAATLAVHEVTGIKECKHCVIS